LWQPEQSEAKSCAPDLPALKFSWAAAGLAPTAMPSQAVAATARTAFGNHDCGLVRFPIGNG
jgi:hypothetical protein